MLVTLVSLPSYAAEPLAIPPLLEQTGIEGGTRLFDLTVREGRTNFFGNGESRTLGYNGNYLGPTIRVQRGQNISIRVKNTLDSDTTVHWHGAHVPAEADGGPHQVIRPGALWKATFTVDQPAATLWYHPHALGTTARQVYLGLAGLLIVDDQTSLSLQIPKTYGVDDIPLIIQDRRFKRDGTFEYRPSGPDIMHGYAGNTALVNGSVDSSLEVPRGIVRFRLLNGSNSSIYRIRFGDGRPFHQIASDGGFLEAPVESKQLVLTAGERAEILVDFGDRKAGDDAGLMLDTLAGLTQRIVTFTVTSRSAAYDEIPAKLAPIERIPETRASRTRTFALESMGHGGALTINGKNMQMNRIDEIVRLGDTEIWEISNRGMGMGMMNQVHSFHIHDIQFLILSINGKDPPPSLSGWKDTVSLWPGDEVRIITTFEDYTGVYMYHCHLLEHEDNGMMGQFEIVD
jgi:FtsP/CotA-like multicopper oxidase with cupredoxin domain